MEKTAEVRSLKSGEQILEKWRVVSNVKRHCALKRSEGFKKKKIN